MSNKPDLILSNGKFITEGSGGNNKYEIKNADKVSEPFEWSLIKNEGYASIGQNEEFLLLVCNVALMESTCSEDTDEGNRIGERHLVLQYRQSMWRSPVLLQ